MLRGRGIDKVLSHGLGVASQEHTNCSSQSQIFERLFRIYAKMISKIIKIEETTEAGHLRKTPAGTRSTMTQSKRGRPPAAKETHAEERQAAMVDAITVPKQEPSNKKTNLVYMTVSLANGWIASNQMGAYPRVSNRGHKCISVFYVYDANFGKGCQ